MIKRLNSRLETSKQPSKQTSNLDSLQRQSQAVNNNQWYEIKSSSNVISKRAHFGSAIIGNQMYVHGGYEAGGKGILADFFCFNLQTQKWSKIQQTSSNVGPRHSHSMAIWDNKLYLFGGMVNTLYSSNQVYSYNILQKGGWKQVKCKGQLPMPLNSHKALVYNDQMIVLGGQIQQKYNQFIYSLDLKTNQWKIISQFTNDKMNPRSDFSMNLYKQKLFIFGGRKYDQKYNQLWQYDIVNNKLKQIETQIYLKPIQRSGHSACIYQQNLIIFGGTTGITHERNDLLIYNIQKNYWQGHWSDQQSQKNEQMFMEKEIVSKSLKKLRTDSVSKKMGCSSFVTNGNSGNSRANQKPSVENDNSEEQNIDSQPKKKYRVAMKKLNYYNQNFPFYGDKQSQSNGKHKKNDLLVDLQKQTKQDLKQSQGGVQNVRKVNIHLTQTFENLNNSIMHCLPSNGGRMETISTNSNEQKNNKDRATKQPKPRDGHSSQIHSNQMIIFGGDRHHMSYNDVVIINLQKVLYWGTKSIGNIDQSN